MMTGHKKTPHTLPVSDPPPASKSGVTCSARKPLEKSPTGRPSFRSPALTSYSVIPQASEEPRAEDASTARASDKVPAKRPLAREEGDAVDPRSEPPGSRRAW
jgi:hypothetical protein